MAFMLFHLLYKCIPVWKFPWVSTFPTGNIAGNGNSSKAASVLPQKTGLSSSISRGAREINGHIYRIYTGTCTIQYVITVINTQNMQTYTSTSNFEKNCTKLMKLSSFYGCVESIFEIIMIKFVLTL